MRKPLSAIALTLVFLSMASAAYAQDLASFEKRVTVEKLDNGLTLIVLRAPRGAGVLVLHARRCRVRRRRCQASPASRTCSSTWRSRGPTRSAPANYAEEKTALAKVEETYAAYDRRAAQEPVGRDEKKLAAAREGVEGRDRRSRQVRREERVRRDRRPRGRRRPERVHLVAIRPGYFYSFPANRLELWAYLESERFLKPVFREFYKERDVVNEERRMRTESSPIGRLIEQFSGDRLHRAPVRLADCRAGRRTCRRSPRPTRQKFFDKYYVPSNMVIAIVGDVKTAEVVPLVDEYFGRLPRRAHRRRSAPSSRRRTRERTVLLQDPSQPIYVEGYHRGRRTDPDDAVYDVISDAALDRPHLAPLPHPRPRQEDRRRGTAASAASPATSTRTSSPFFAVPTPGHTPEESEAAIREEIEKTQERATSRPTSCSRSRRARRRT